MVDHHVVEFAGAVDLDVDGVRRQREAVDTDKSRRADAGLQAGPAARGIGRRFHQRKAKLDIAQAQAKFVGTAAVQPHKGADMAGADGQQRDFLRRCIGQRDGRGALLDAKTAVDLEEAKQVDVQVAGDPQQLAVAAFHCELQSVGDRRAGDQLQRIGVGEIVDHDVVQFCRLVDLDCQRSRRQGQAFNADKRDTAHARLQARPAARRIGLGRHQREAELDAGKLQAQLVRRAAIQARKGRDVAGPDRQQRYVDRRSIGELDRRIAFFDAEAARDLEEAEQVDIQISGRADQLALRAGHRQLQRIRRPGDQRQVSAAIGVIDDDVVQFAGLVDLDVQCVRRQREAVNADKRDAADARLQARPTAGRVAGRLHQRDAKLDAGELEAEFVGGTAVQAGKSADAAGADR